MIRTLWLAGIAALAITPAAPAQTEAWKFHWQVGHVLDYQVEQTTTVTEIADGNKTETLSKLSNRKHWQVLGVDASGTATLQLSLTALRIETTPSSGEVMRFDSQDPEKSNPQMREQLSKYVGQPLAVIRVTAQGKVVEVKESKFGPASRFESEPPFVITFPEGGPVAAWERPYQITLEPPQGTGQKYEAVQKYAFRAGDGRTATFDLKTELKAPPESVAEQIPLLQGQLQGEVTFEVQTGVFRAARLRIEKELKGQQGEGSSYHFQSTYVEQFLGQP
jgi:hypothetical protein